MRRASADHVHVDLRTEFPVGAGRRIIGGRSGAIGALAAGAVAHATSVAGGGIDAGGG